VTFPILGLASVCVLSFNRPEFLAQAIEHARDQAGYPCEIVAHDDGSKDPDVYPLLLDLLNNARISRLVLQPPGHNQGVGESIRAAFGVASGEILVKYDQDLIARPGWLAKAVAILDAPAVFSPVTGTARVGCVGLFRYDHDPVDHRKMFLHQHDGYQEVEDFVGSAFAIKRSVYEECGPITTHSDGFGEDKTLKEAVQAKGYILALPDEDVVSNVGWGVGPSTVNEAFEDDGSVRVAKIHHGPVQFHAA
jgi:glycosyltransferase involved in cell wall biosynthesis